MQPTFIMMQSYPMDCCRTRKEVAGMQILENIRNIITDDSITLYWEKIAEIPTGCSYEILLNGKTVGTTDKTHYEVEGLQPRTVYELQVIGRENNRADAPVLFASKVMKLETGKAKKMIDVTLAPYYAAGDGQTMNTKALQAAFDACGSDEAVYLPAGIYMTGALRMHSDMELYLEEGAVLQGTDVVADYLPKIKSRFEGIENESYSSLLNLGELDRDGDYNCRNVVIRGKGTIASGGRVLAERVIALERELMKDYLAELGDKINECEKPETIPGRVRPRLINMSNCQNITISSVTLKNGASWNVHMIYSDNIVTNGCTFHSHGVWNGDGWDPDSSTNCTLFGCDFYTGDDVVAIKSGKNPEGNLVNRPTEHIWIFDCVSHIGHGMAIGSEMSGGISDVKIWDCDLENAMYGIEIKGTKKRGGYVRNVQVRDCKVGRVSFHSVTYNDDGIGAPTAPIFENCSFEGLQIFARTCETKTKKWSECDAVELLGFDEPGHELKNILFKDIVLGGEGQSNSRKYNISLGLCENITFEKIRTAR